MNFFWQLLARLIFWPIILAGMLFAVFNIAVKIMLDDVTLRSVVSYGLSEALKGQADMTWAKLSPSGKIQIRGLRLRDPSQLEENLLSAENVFVKISPLSIITGKPEIREISFIAPKLEIIKNERSEWNLQHYLAAYKKKDSDKSFAAAIRETYIRDGEIIIKIKKENTKHEFRNLNVSLHDFSPESNTTFEASSSFTVQGRKKPAEGRIFTKGTINFQAFDFSKAEVKDINGKVLINSIEIPFSGSIQNFTAPSVKIKASNPAIKHTDLDYLFDSAIDFSAPKQEWDISLSAINEKISIDANTSPLDIHLSGSIQISSPAAYQFKISAPPLPLENLAKHLDLFVKDPKGKVKPEINIASEKDGQPKLTELAGDFSNSNFKYKKLSATGLDMMLNLTENLENSNVTVYDGRLQLGPQRLTTLVLNGAISKKNMGISFSGRLNGDPTKGKLSMLNPFSKVKSVYYTGYSQDLQYNTAKTLIFNLIDLLSDKTGKRKRKFSQLQWVNQLRNSIPSGYSLFNIVYKAGIFRHEFIQAENFYVTVSINSLSGKIENLKGKLSIKAGHGTLFNVEENSKKDRIHYLASMPLRFIDELNKKKAFKFDKLENVSFNAMGGDITADKGIAIIENFYMDGSEFSACLTGTIDFINETVDLKIYTIMDKYSRGVLPAGLTDASGKSAMAFSLTGKMDSPVLNMLSPKDASKRIAEAALREPAVNFGKIRRLLGGK